MGPQFEPTPHSASRYGVSPDDSKILRKKVDTFSTLVNLVQQMNLLHGARVTDDDDEFGRLLEEAGNEIDVCALSCSRLTNRISRRNRFQP